MEGYRFDIDRWQSLLLEEGFPGCRHGFLVTGPRDMVYLEHFRRLAQEERHLGPARRTDVFVFAHGRAPDRDVTKVGGLPYRPSGEAWPVAEDGEPMVFLAQFRFVESRDLVGNLPGDVLLVFSKGESLHSVQPQEYLHFEWYPIGISRLVRSEEVPPISRQWPFVNCFGYRHRTVDYQRIVALPVLESMLFPRFRSTPPVDDDAEQFSRVDGMKIGGLPVCACTDKRHRTNKRPTGRFICSLASIWPIGGATYPWVNVASAAPLMAGLDPAMHLDFADGFTLNMYLRDSGRVAWTMCMH